MSELVLCIGLPSVRATSTTYVAHIVNTEDWLYTMNHVRNNYCFLLKVIYRAFCIVESLIYVPT
jgi:hypothetical protein